MIVTMHGDAGRVDLHIAGVGKGCSLAMAHPCRATVAVHGIGGEVIEVAVSAGGEHHGMGGIAFQVAGDEIADDDAAGAAFHHDQVHHLAARVQFHRASGDFAA